MVGTGLGLSIVKNILKAHHFEYGVSSIQNKGTTFYFIITNQTKKESEKGSSDSLFETIYKVG